MTVPLRHGVFMAPFHSRDENPTLALERDLQLMGLLDELGFQEAWIGEHHSAGLETIDSPEVFIAAAAERTKHIRLGTGVVSLPYHHPLNVANRIIQLDHMTRGRVMFGAGPGLLASDALMMGIEPASTRDRMEQGIDVILRLFQGEFVTEQTDWYTMRDAHTHLRPYTYPHPEVCVASAVTPSGGRLAGKYDLGMLCVAAGERAGFDALATNWQVACEIAAEHGREMDRSRLRCVVSMHLADTRDQAIRNIRFGTEEYIRYFNNNQPRFDVPEGADYVDWVVENEIGVVGTYHDAIERIERLYERQGEFGAVLLMVNNWADWPQQKRSFEIYANHVIPHFAHTNENRYRSYDWVTKNQDELVQKRVSAANQMFEKHNAERAAKGIATPDGPLPETSRSLS
jgi:limonene 1,2-monooxygenase